MDAIASGALVTLTELNQSSAYLKQGASLRVTGKLVDYNLVTAMAVIVDSDSSIQVDTSLLTIHFRVGSLYQFIGELNIEPNGEGTLRARVGRIVDGLDMNLYQQSLQLLREHLPELALAHNP